MTTNHITYHAQHPYDTESFNGINLLTTTYSPIITKINLAFLTVSLIIISIGITIFFLTNACYTSIYIGTLLPSIIFTIILYCVLQSYYRKSPSLYHSPKNHLLHPIRNSWKVTQHINTHVKAKNIINLDKSIILFQSSNSNKITLILSKLSTPLKNLSLLSSCFNQTPLNFSIFRENHFYIETKFIKHLTQQINNPKKLESLIIHYMQKTYHMKLLKVFQTNNNTKDNLILKQPNCIVFPFLHIEKFLSKDISPYNKELIKKASLLGCFLGIHSFTQTISSKELFISLEGIDNEEVSTINLKKIFKIFYN